MKVRLTQGLEETKEFGKISKLEFPNGSIIYISKKGWSLGTPIKKGKKLNKLIDKLKTEKRCEIRISFGEIQVAIKETINQGYITKGG